MLPVRLWVTWAKKKEEQSYADSNQQSQATEVAGSQEGGMVRQQLNQENELRSKG